jgi:hypothetical protein
MIKLSSLASIVTLGLWLSACSSRAPDLGQWSSAVWTNGGFETGTNNNPPPAPWGVSLFLNPSITLQTPQTYGGLNLATAINGHAPPVALTVIQAAAGGPMSQPDALLGAGASLRWPRFGNQCALVNRHGKNQNVNQMTQTMTTAAGDVDPVDGQIHVRFVVAPVLEDPGHPANEQPYFFVQLTNVTQNTVLYSNFNFSNQAGVPWKTVNTGGTTYDYTDWQLIDIAPGAPALNMGDQVELFLIASGCSLGGHIGQLYVDGVGTGVSGLFISGTGPAQANAGSNITYQLTYQNGGATAESGVVVTFNTPPNTTFVSLNAPGLTCSTPTAGMTGTITCTVGTLPKGGSGSFQITVNINSSATGTITAGDYQIQSNTSTPLLGPIITTMIGCTQDSQCPSGQWCNESGNACTPTLPNGTAIPSDPPHTNPTLNAMCTAQAGTLVCTSGVCDASDNKCGYANGDGSCNAGNGGTVCRSGVCDPDGKCGYANGDGPCDAGSGGTVCRSGVCSANGTCMPAGGCNVDADCSGGKWCQESMHSCMDKLPNGTAMPSDGPHTNPTLDGSCTQAAAMLVCVSAVCDGNDNKCGYLNGDGMCTAGNGGNGATVCRSGVCDPDMKCGYADGDGPCTAGNGGNGATVCRSGVCSMNGLCEPAGGCNVDADCAADHWCEESMHTCMAKLPNGTAMPSDGPHMNPTLDGTCTADAGTLVCASTVCDTHDNKCGYADGDGPCTSGNGGTVCRSGACSMSGTCEPMGGCNVDADCATGQWCDESIHTCEAQLANGMPMPSDGAHMNPTLDGTCSPDAGVLVCASGVCDTSDNKCGYADGDGPCTSGDGGTVCRSGACSMSGTCQPMGGCNVDADCATGQWCDESMHQCLAQLANGTPLPTDAPHMNPTLDGTCTPAAATLVCQSGVCDTSDNRCGYANGNGPCTSGDGGTVCRSGTCSMSGTCAPMGGCNSNADCTNPNAPLCDTTSHTCGARSGGGGGNGATGTFFGGGFCGVTATGGAAAGATGDALAVALVLLALAWRARRRGVGA